MINGDKNHKMSSKNFNNEDLNRPLERLLCYV
jgi:hypothetical protein